MSSTICYSAINPRPLKLRKPVSSFVGTLEVIDTYKIIDIEKEIVEVHPQVIIKDSYDTDKLSNSFKGQTGIRAFAKKVAFPDLVEQFGAENNTLYDATNMPTDLREVKDVINAGNLAKQNMAKLPKAITKDQSPEDFVKNFKMEDVINYVKSLYDNKVEKKEVKEKDE